MNGLHLSPIMKTLDNPSVSIGIIIYTLGNVGHPKVLWATITNFTIISTTTVATTTSSVVATTIISVAAATTVNRKYGWNTIYQRFLDALYFHPNPI